jgi:hypothetical protein
VHVSSEMRDEGFRKLHELELEPRKEYAWKERHGEWEDIGAD